MYFPLLPFQSQRMQLNQLIMMSQTKFNANIRRRINQINVKNTSHGY